MEDKKPGLAFSYAIVSLAIIAVCMVAILAPRKQAGPTKEQLWADAIATCANGGTFIISNREIRCKIVQPETEK